MDSLLRALTNPITAARLDRRTKKLAEVVEDNVVKFPTLASANRLREASMLAETFELRANG
jgi:hypothetical protein